MKCPHCLTSIHESFRDVGLNQHMGQGQYATLGHPPRYWIVKVMECPACRASILKLSEYISVQGPPLTSRIVFPEAYNRPIPPEVGEPYRSEFREACAVLPYSEKASAALSRRCLQMVLVDKGGAKKKGLYDQIEETATTVPSDLAENLHAIRVIGNFAAHPTKDKNTGEVVDVEPGEAEWNLETLEQLFDFYFVKPAMQAKRKSALNEKLKAIGKPLV